MNIPDNVLRHALGNVYCIAGTPRSGKTTLAAALAAKHDMAHFDTDDARRGHYRLAERAHQPTAGGDPPDHSALPPQDAWARERELIRDMSPMIAVELIALCARFDRVLCEGVDAIFLTELLPLERVLFLTAHPDVVAPRFGAELDAMAGDRATRLVRDEHTTVAQMVQFSEHHFGLAREGDG